MKKIFGIFVLALVGVVSVQLSSCGGGSASQSPVDQYIAIVEKAVAETEKVTNVTELHSINTAGIQAEAQEIIDNNPDYELTDEDKEKLKSATDKLLKIAFEKSIEFNGLSEEMKEASKSQLKMAIDISNKRIEEAKTLSQINGIR